MKMFLKVFGFTMVAIFVLVSLCVVMKFLLEFVPEPWGAIICGWMVFSMIFADFWRDRHTLFEDKPDKKKFAKDSM